MLRPGETLRYETRRHGIVLVPPLARALVLASSGAALLSVGGVAGAMAAAVLLALAALLALDAAWAWERTRLVVTSEKLVVVHGRFRRRAAAVRLARVGAVETEQTVAGRVLGYGTLIAGDLEVQHVPHPGAVADLLGA